MFFKVILFLIIIKSLSSLNSNDFCYSNEVICLNNRECTKECNDLLRKYKCSGQLCTKKNLALKIEEKGQKINF